MIDPILLVMLQTFLVVLVIGVLAFCAGVLFGLFCDDDDDWSHYV